MRWNLSSIYPNPSQAKNALSLFKNHIATFHRSVEQGKFDEAFLSLQEGCALLKQVESYAACLLAVNPQDGNAQALQAECNAVRAEAESSLFFLGVALSKYLGFEAWVQRQGKLAYFLRERRAFTLSGLDLPQEELIEVLSIDGYHSYWALYRLITGKMKLIFRGKELSIGQADNLLSHPDRALRSELFSLWNRTWESQADLFALILNHLAGFRLHTYAKRKWSDVLYEPLRRNRMEKKTLEAMWEAAEKSRPLFVRFLTLKAKRMGLKKLSWHDLQTPTGQPHNAAIPYVEAQKIILHHFKNWHPPLANFSKKAFENGWIEAENRPGKQPGGFCVFFPKSNESRIFMTYQETLMCMTTLAHELGHGYHSECLTSLPYFAQEYKMNLAETASTLAEAVVAEGAYHAANSREEKLYLLEEKLLRICTFLMNLHARFIFETDFYEERKKGLISAERLSEMMLRAQKVAFGDALEEYSPFFWASKLHFYATDEPFYNFPYTFGFLLSQVLKDKPEQVDAFLRESACDSTEELARLHLGVDLTSSTFWKGIIDRFERDVEEYATL